MSLLVEICHRCIGNFMFFFKFNAFLKSQVLQGRAARTVRCGGQNLYGFVQNVFLSAALKEFWKSIHIWQSYWKNSAPTLFETQCNFVLHWIQTFGKKIIKPSRSCDNSNVPFTPATNSMLSPHLRNSRVKPCSHLQFCSMLNSHFL